MTDRYDIKKYLEEYRQALEPQPEKPKQPTRPNFLEMLRTGGKLGQLNTEKQE